MGVMVDFSEIEALAKRMKAVEPAIKTSMIEAIVNEANNRHIARVVAATPVDSGTLRQRWSHGIQRATWEGKRCVARLSNSLEYAPYVEYGHRTRDKKRWVKGRFMLSRSMGRVKADLKSISEREIKRVLGGAVNGK